MLHAPGKLSSVIFRETMSGEAPQEKIKFIKYYADRLAVQADVSFNRVTYHRFNTIALFHLREDKKLEAMTESLPSPSINESLPSPSPDESLPSPSTEMIGSSDQPNPSVFLDAASKQEEDRKQLVLLLSKLNVDQHTDVASNDAADQMRLILTMSQASRDRAVATIGSTGLQDWIGILSSHALFVNGEMFLYENKARQSPLSVFCAKVTDTALHHQAKSSDSIIVVRWFCGLHTNMQTDPDAHPTAILRHIFSRLLRQLLKSPKHFPVFGVARPIEELGLGALCETFHKLVKSLTWDIILFIVIDGISYYEDPEREEQCVEVMSMLFSLAKLAHPLIKTLVTATLPSRHVRELFQEEDVLDLDT
ncbi:MAG: hypothetical protein L6R40_007209 [Gallowayella cf. fulva]|nr:MAG: hypothetical protein L6R40_007209 [Xanthomendoza cf. fulva]